MFFLSASLLQEIDKQRVVKEDSIYSHLPILLREGILAISAEEKPHTSHIWQCHSLHHFLPLLSSLSDISQEDTRLLKGSLL